MKVTEIVNNMGYELLPCVECQQLTPNRQRSIKKHLEIPLCSNCMKDEYVNGESF